MGLFERKPKFVAAVCPNCGGNLELDSNFKVAICKECGAQCIVQNVKNKKEKKTSLEVVVDFVERQQSLHRADKREKERKLEEEQQKNSEHFKKYWWVYVLILVFLFGLIFTMAILEGLGIIS